MIIVITPEHFNYKDEIAILERVASFDCVRIHIRKPNAKVDDLRLFLNQLSDTCLAKVSLHDFYFLRHEFAITGVHVTGRARMQPNGWEDCLGEVLVSTSFHSFEEVERCEYLFDYAFLSPIFPSISKHNYEAAFNYDDLKRFMQLKQSRMPLVALGGLTLESVSLVKSWGFSGAAFLGAFWESADREALLEAAIAIESCV